MKETHKVENVMTDVVEAVKGPVNGCLGKRWLSGRSGPRAVLCSGGGQGSHCWWLGPRLASGASWVSQFIVVTQLAVPLRCFHVCGPLQPSKPQSTAL